MLNRPFLYIGLLLALWQPRAANANESAMDAVDDREGGIQAVTVTARRVEEDSQHVPVAVTVVSGSQLQDHGLFTTESLGQLAPGLTGIRKSRPCVFQYPWTALWSRQLFLRGADHKPPTRLDQASSRP